MAIPAQNATYLQTGPSATQQILAFGPSSGLEVAYIGTATFVLDGTLTSATLNFIDGTAALSFTPSAVLVFVTGGTQSAAAYVTATADTITTTTCVVRFSIAGTNANTVKIGFMICK
jgi:hypothetical protein